MYWRPFLDAAGLLAMLVGIVVSAIATELSPSLSTWWTERCGLIDREQSPAVRRLALILNSPKRRRRARAAELLGDLNDRTAVPGIVRAMRRYRRDPLFLEACARSLGALGDPRAVDALRPLTAGHNLSLMTAARAARARLEPSSLLLRAAAAPQSCLLRPARAQSTPSERLLRAGDRE